MSSGINKVCMNVDAARQLAETIVGNIEGRADILIAIVAGSIRRGCVNIGDIDIVAVDKKTERGNGSIERFNQTGIAVQVYHCNINDYEPMLLFLTGSKEFNLMMRRKALRCGWHLSQYGLKNDSGDVICSCEIDILQRLGFTDYLNPRKRSI